MKVPKLTWVGNVSTFLAENEAKNAVEVSATLLQDKGNGWQVIVICPKQWTSESLMLSLINACLAAGIFPNEIRIDAAKLVIVN